MEAPYAIASLPKPLDSAHGRVQTAPAHSIRGSKKRKRHEIAVGIDGEGVNVYNVNKEKQISTTATTDPNCRFNPKDL